MLFTALTQTSAKDALLRRKHPAELRAAEFLQALNLQGLA